MDSIASEKFIGLLRRIAAFARDNKKEDDETIVRHIYDLHLIKDTLFINPSIKNLIYKVIKSDVEQFGNQSHEFRDNPIGELKYALRILSEDPVYEDRYNKFIGPLVYHPMPAGWNEAIATILRLASVWLV